MDKTFSTQAGASLPLLPDTESNSRRSYFFALLSGNILLAYVIVKRALLGN